MHLLPFAQTSLYSLAIAALIWWLTDFGSFLQVLLVSLSIGWSIHLAFILTHERLNQWFGSWLAPAVVVALGLFPGLFLGGTLVAGQTLYFFSQDFTTMVLGLFFGIVGFLIFGTRERLHSTRQLLAETELKRSQQEKLLTETELKLVQAQVEPHFLFNTLSNISQLIRSNPDLAVSTLENLTTLLRVALTHTRSSKSTLGQEVNFSKAYLAIQATRMQGRLRYRCDLTKVPRDVLLPPLLIQPLLENAVLHGIGPDPKGGEIEFTAQLTDGKLVLSVSDNGVGMNESGTSNGTGLRNVRDRLRLIYGPAATLELTPGSPRGVKARIAIPLATTS